MFFSKFGCFWYDLLCSESNLFIFWSRNNPFIHDSCKVTICLLVFSSTRKVRWGLEFWGAFRFLLSHDCKNFCINCWGFQLCWYLCSSFILLGVNCWCMYTNSPNVCFHVLVSWRPSQHRVPSPYLAKYIVPFFNTNYESVTLFKFYLCLLVCVC